MTIESVFGVLDDVTDILIGAETAEELKGTFAAFQASNKAIERLEGISLLHRVLEIIERHISWADTDYEAKKLMRMKNEVRALGGDMG